ncbi:23S rRNA (guanosine(2251)-2'-O)-methyltransferase RlmB, partial [bacterium]|nr:23S rRNA (guanosine(2251)-2'-O)-methyltransferase RlmB [bacterium]
MGLKKISGRRAVIEALRSSQTQVEKIILARGTHGSILQEIQNLAETRGLVIEIHDRRRLEKVAGPVAHQGVIAILKSREYADWHAMLAQAKAQPTGSLFVIADEIEDPRNLGAIARCAEGAGALGMVITTHRSAEITEAAAKASG